MVKSLVVAGLLGLSLIASRFYRFPEINFEPTNEEKKDEVEYLHRRLMFSGDKSVSSCINNDLVQKYDLNETYQWCTYCSGERLRSTNCKQSFNVFEGMPQVVIDNYLTYLREISSNEVVEDYRERKGGLVSRLN